MKNFCYTLSETRLAQDYTLYDYVYMNSRTGNNNLWCKKKEQWLPVDRMVERLTGKGYKGNFCSNDNVLHLNRCLSCTGVCFCQYPLHGALKFCAFHCM